MRKVQGRVVSHQQFQNARRRQRYFLNASTRGVRNGAGDRGGDVEDRDFAGALGSQRPDRRRAFIEADLHRHYILSERRPIGLQAALADAAVGADRDLLVQGVTQALNHAALNLPEHGTRIERPPDVLNDGIAEHLDMARFRIHRDFAFVHGEHRNVDRVDEVAARASRHRGDARARVNTIYMTSIFLGGTLSTAISGAIYDSDGWIGVTRLGAGLAFIALGIWAVFALRRRGASALS